MATRHRTALSVLVLLVLAGFVLAGRWYAQRRATPALTPSHLTITVTSDGDRGPGTLREALFAADTAGNAAEIAIRVGHIALATTLPPLVNPHGIHIVAGPGGVDIDARAVRSGNPLFDIDAERSSLEGLTIQGCPVVAILVRAARFRLADSAIQFCDIGVEIAAGADDAAIEHNRFRSDRIGVRFSAASPGSLVLDNQFADNGTAGLWLVASQPQFGTDAIGVQNNQFSADGTDVVLGNIPAVLQHNDFTALHDAAVQVIGTGAVVRDNHISNGPAAGILVENARGALIEANELDHLNGYGILLRRASDTLVRANRIDSCSYGIAFVLGDAGRPNSAVDNTLIDLRYDGIDVLGESPILRRNQVLQARAWPLRVTDFSAPDGAVVRARPLLERNRFELAPVASQRTVSGQGTLAGQGATHAQGTVVGQGTAGGPSYARR